MSGGMLANMLGMGVTVQLLDMFTPTSNQVANSSEALANKLQRDANKTSNAWNGLFVGGAMAASGMGILHVVANIGKRALESSSQLEIFRNQFHVMIKDYAWAEKVYHDSIQFATKTPFTIPEVVGAAKTLRAFGFQANQIGGELKVAGDWAAMFGERIEKTSEIMGRAMAGGYGRALVYMRGKGINDKDIQEMARQQGTYNDLFDASGRTKRGYDGNKMVAAMNALLVSKYGGEMEKRMGTIPGMASNIEDQMILLMSKVGDEFKPRLKSLMHSILQDLSGEQMAGLGKAIGMGLDVLLRILGAVIIPLEKVVTWLGKLSEQHPAFVKWITVIVATAGALLFLTGTWIVWMAVTKLWKVSGIVEQFASLQRVLLAFASGPMVTLAIAAVILYAVWKNNFGGIQEMVKKWWGTLKIVFTAMSEGFASIQNGVVTFSEETYNALDRAGVAPWTINVMAVLYRLYQILVGVWKGFSDIVNIVGFVVGGFSYIIMGAMKLIEWILRATGVLSGLADKMSSGVYTGFGRVIGWLVGLFAAYWFVTRLVTAATAIWSAVTFAARVGALLFALATGGMNFSLMSLIPGFTGATAGATSFAAALWANPITWIVAAVLLLIGLIVLLVVKWKEIHAWIMKSPDWLLAITPFVGVPMLIIKHWSQIKTFFINLGHTIKGVWNSVTDWIYDKVAAVMAFFLRVMVKITQMLPSWLKPDALKSFDNIDADKIDSQFVRNFTSNTLDGYKQARLQGASMANAYAAGVASNNRLVNSLTNRPNQPIQLNSTLQLDGRVVARSTQRYMNEEAASGRTD